MLPSALQVCLVRWWNSAAASEAFIRMAGGRRTGAAARVSGAAAGLHGMQLNGTRPQAQLVSCGGHAFIRAGRPQTNGRVGRVQQAILDEYWKPAFARVADPQADRAPPRP
jgi:hypothetical protein